MQHAPPSDPLAKVRNPDGTVDWLKVGKAYNNRLEGRATPEEDAVIDFLIASGGLAYVVVKAKGCYDDWVEQQARERGCTIVTTTTSSRNGRRVVKTTIRRYPSRTARPVARRPRTRAPRRRVRRTGSGARTSGTDPGEPGLPEPSATGSGDGFALLHRLTPGLPGHYRRRLFDRLPERLQDACWRGLEAEIERFVNATGVRS